MRFATVCSGIEAASAAWEPHGWAPVFFSEIEPFPCAVLAHRHPEVPNHGDMTQFEDWPDADVDVLAGGTPCQSFSVAGLRAGLADPRGNLMLTYLAIARRYRPRWVVWENVPGVLSSNGGREFGAFLRGLGECGYGFAYRVLDAQFCRTRRFPRAVPQRRRRVFVVGYLGDWRPAAAVLFDAESLRGNPSPRREAGQRPAPTISARPTGGGGLGTDFDCDGGLITSTGDVAHCLNAGAMGRIDYESETMVAHSLRGEGFDASEDVTGRGTPMVPVAIQERAVSDNLENGPQGAGIRADGAAYTLEARNKVQAVAFDLNQITSKTNRSQPNDSVHHTLPATTCPPHLATPWAVRRLTPVECERLMGFPEVSEKVIFSAWSDDRLQPHASAEIQCTTRQRNALNVDVSASPQAAKNADQSSSTSQAAHAPPVVLHVFLDCEREAVEIRSAEKLIWSASTAATPSASPLPMPPADFARLVALTTQTAGKTTADGKAVSRTTEKNSFHHWSGKTFVDLSGQEIDAHADAVAMCMSDLKTRSTFTTSLSIANIPTSALTLTTLCCSVLSATGSFIPHEMQQENSFSLMIEVRCGFTRIPYRNKPAENCPDGPRYKALGNSWAVNCADWLAERIRHVEAILKSEAA